MALFWLSDEAWTAIEPHLPKNQPGARRVDDRRLSTCSRSDAGGATARPTTVRQRRSIIPSTAGRRGGAVKLLAATRYWCRLPAPRWASQPRASRPMKRMAAAHCSAD